MLDSLLYLLTLSFILGPVWSLDQEIGEFPLNNQDISLVIRNNQSPFLHSSQDNFSCLLTHLEKTDEICTWRKIKQCVQIPSVVRVAVYSQSCHEEHPRLFLSDCKVLTKTEPLTHTVEVCSIVADKECMGPCYDCPKFCQPTEQGFCEHSHSIRTDISEADENGRVMRIERDVVTSTKNCYTKEVDELCANVNCKFVNPREECVQRNSSTVVNLRERKCNICSPTQTERVELEKKCRDIETRDCDSDPLERPWKKVCSVPSNFQHNSLDARLEELDRGANQGPKLVGRGDGHGRVSLQDLLSSSISSPVNDLVVRTLSKINLEQLGQFKNPVVVIHNAEEDKLIKQRKDLVEEKAVEEMELLEVEDLLKEKEDILEEQKELLQEQEELQLIKNLQEKTNQPININMNVKYEFLTPSSTASPTFFSSSSPSTSSLSPSTNILPSPSPNSIYFDQLLLTHLQEPPRKSTPLTLNLRSLTATTGTSPPTTATFTISTTTTTTSTTTTTATTSTTTTTTTTATIAQHRRKLSPAELLRLCFETGTGCDFSQNEVAYEEDTTEVARTTTTTTTPRPLPSSVKDRLKNRVMLCFFQGICGNDANDDITTRPPRIVTTSRPRSTTARSQTRREQISASIRERARACFFEGKC